MPIARTLPVALIALAAAPVLAAQPEISNEQDAEQIAQSKPSALTLLLHASAGYQSDADFDNSIGQLSLAEYHAGLTAIWNLEDAGTLNIDLSAGLLDYDVSPSPSAVAGDAASIGAELDNIEQYGLNATYSDSLNANTSWFVGGGIGFSGETHADFGDSFDWLAMGGVQYKQSDTLSLGIGVAVKSRLEDDVLVIPLPRISWQISDQWSLNSQRAGVKLSYKHSDALSYGLWGEYRSDSFRLDNTHAAAPEGMGTHRRFPVAMFAQYTPSDRVSIEGSVGAALGGELEFLDTNGNDVSKQNIDPGVFGSISLSFRF